MTGKYLYGIIIIKPAGDIRIAVAFDVDIAVERLHCGVNFALAEKRRNIAIIFSEHIQRCGSDYYFIV